MDSGHRVWADLAVLCVSVLHCCAGNTPTLCRPTHTSSSHAQLAWRTNPAQKSEWLLPARARLHPGRQSSHSLRTVLRLHARPVVSFGSFRADCIVPALACCSGSSVPAGIAAEVLPSGSLHLDSAEASAAAVHNFEVGFSLTNGKQTMLSSLCVHLEAPRSRLSGGCC